MSSTVLVIEDNPVNLELATDLLNAAGYRVVSASSAEEGIAMARAQLPALIVMDVRLPGMNGLEATRVLRQDPITSGIPIVVVTSQAMADDKQHIVAAGCNGYLTKPIDTRTFVQAIVAHITDPRSTQDAASK